MVDPLSFSGIFLFIAAFAAGFVDSVAGGGGLIQVPALFAVNFVGLNGWWILPVVTLGVLTNKLLIQKL